MHPTHALAAMAVAIVLPATLHAAPTGSYYYDPDAPSQPAPDPAAASETPEEWYYRNYVLPRGAYLPASLNGAEISEDGSPSGDGIYNNEYGANDDSDLY